MSFDLQRLLNNVEGDEEFARELIETFLETLPKALMEVRASVQAGNPAQLRETAHALKGAIGNFDLGAPWQAAYALEQLGRNGETAGSPEGLARLEETLNALVGEMHVFLEKEKPA